LQPPRQLQSRDDLLAQAVHSAAREWFSLFAPKIVFSGCHNTRTSRLRQPVRRIRLMRNMRLIFKIIGSVLRFRRHFQASGIGTGAI